MHASLVVSNRQLNLYSFGFGGRSSIVMHFFFSRMSIYGFSVEGL